MIQLLPTPVEEYRLKGHDVLVKREDLASPAPGPTFSKVRGLVPVLQRLKSKGIKKVAYTESAISMAGWGVAWACKELQIQSIIFDPQYKETPDLLAFHREQWNKFGATIIPIPAGRAKIGWFQSKKWMKQNCPKDDWELLPLGLPYPETVDAAAVEMRDTLKKYQPGCVVVPVGSGTVAAGVVQACPTDLPIYGVLCRTGNISIKMKIMMNKGGWTVYGLRNRRSVILTDPGYEYTDEETISLPFPCHRYYDAKAAKWMLDNIDNLPQPCLFWNIGSEQR